MNRSFVKRRLSCLTLALGTAMAVLGTIPGGASASTAPPHHLRPEVHAALGSKMSLAQAPAGLQAVVRRTLRAPAGPAGRAVQQAKLTASDGVPGDTFGVSVAISGSTAVVGDSFKNSQTGAAYVFVRSGTAWSQQARLTASDPAKDSVFGDSVAVSGSTVVVGANHGAGSDTGAAYMFVRSGTAWSQQAKLTASDGVSRDFFGGSVAISRSTAVMGADGNNSATGAAYVFVKV